MMLKLHFLQKKFFLNNFINRIQSNDDEQIAYFII